MWGPLPREVQMSPRITHHEAFVEKVMVRLSGKPKILAKIPFEVLFFFFLTASQSKDLSSECTSEGSLMGQHQFRGLFNPIQMAGVWETASSTQVGREKFSGAPPGARQSGQHPRKPLAYHPRLSSNMNPTKTY